MRHPVLSLSITGVLAAGCYAPQYATFPPPAATSIVVGTVSGARRFCPAGPELQLRADVRLADGKTLVTWAYGPGGTSDRDGLLDFASFAWRASAGAITADGLYQPPADPLVALDRPVTIDVAVRRRPDLHAQLVLAPRYDCTAIVERVAAAGANGANGSDGASGTSGSDGDSPTSGGDGGDGGDGSDGDPGARGPTLEVALAYVDGAAGRHVLARVGDAHGAQYVVLDPSAPPLTVIARGGKGGDGGGGGRGGKGGAGGRASDGTSATSGNDGRDGSAGDGGRGGDGGVVHVVFDRRHPELASMVSIDNRGGDGGVGLRHGARGDDGPPPTFWPVDAGRLFAGELARGVAIER